MLTPVATWTASELDIKRGHWVKDEGLGNRTLRECCEAYPFSGWAKTFTDPRLCAAIVDRLTFNGQIIETGTSSYRLAQARDARKAQPRG